MGGTRIRIVRDRGFCHRERERGDLVFVETRDCFATARNDKKWMAMKE